MGKKVAMVGLVPKRPAGIAKKPAGVLKKPASWKDFADEVEAEADVQAGIGEFEPDSSPITAQQRFVFKHSFASLPKSIQDQYTAVKSSGERGSVKKGYEIINAIVPKSVSYGSELKLDKGVFERMRKITHKNTRTFEAAGYSYTQITGTGMLGSDEKLQEGISRGDVTMKVVS